MRILAIAAALLVACSDGDGGPDAGSLCAMVCPAAGGTCAGEVCRIAGTGESLVSCPTGVACEVDCTHAGQPCRDGVRCAGATACTVTCVGTRACQAGVDCAASTCTVTCDGDEACEGGIRGSGGTCTSHCCGVDACAQGTGACTNDNQCP
jgi:hypothetical protein